MLFGLTLIAVIAAKDMLKGLIAGFFGLLIGVIGTDHIYNTPRATFGFLELYDGVPLVPALIGLFAISEALVMIEEKMIVSAEGRAERAARARWADTVEGLRMSLQNWWHIVWTAFVGLFIGIMPGAGASIAAFVAYQQSRMWSKHPGALRHRHARGRDRARGGQQRRHVGYAGPDDGARRSRRQHGGGHDDRAAVPRHGDGAAALHHQSGGRLRRVRLDGGRVHLHDLHHPAARALHVAHRADRDDVSRADHHPGDDRRRVRRAPVPVRHGAGARSSA